MQRISLSVLIVAFSHSFAYTQSISKPIVNDVSLTFLSDQVCQCLGAASTLNQETLNHCFEEKFTQHGEQLLADNNLTGSTEVGKQIGLLLVKRLEETCPAFRKLRSDSPAQKMAIEAEALRAAGRPQEALQLFDRLINPSLAQINWTLYNDRGLCRLELDDLYGAIADFEYAIRRDSTAANAYNNRGLAKQRLGDKQGAFDDFTLALQIDSTKALFFQNRGVLLYTDEQYDRAAVDLLQSVKLEPTSAGSYHYLGLCGRGSQNYSDTTARYFTKAIELAPDNYQYRNDRGLFYDDKKAYQQAKTDYLEAVKLNPDYNPAYYNLAQLALQEKRPAEAITFINKAIKLDSTYDFYFDAKAKALLDLKRYNEALAANDRSIALSPKRAEMYDRRGDICTAMNDMKGAASAYSTSIDLDSGDGTVYYRRGTVRLKLNDKTGACADFGMGSLLKNKDAANAQQTYCR